MFRADEKFQRGIEGVNHVHVGGQCGRIGDGTERRVDITCRDGGDGGAWVVDPKGHHVEVGPGVRLPVVVENNGLRAPQAEDVDPQRPGTRPHRGDGTLDTGDDAPRVGKERLAVERQLDPSGGTREQTDFQLALQGGDPLGNRLLSHAQFIGRVPQPSELGRPDE